MSVMFGEKLISNNTNYTIVFIWKIRNSEIYTTPRLAETLENGVSFGGSCLANAANNLGHINSNNFNTSNTNGSTTINNPHLHPKHRIDTLTTITTGSPTIPTTNTLSTSSLSQSMDSSVDSKLRQGKYITK